MNKTDDRCIAIDNYTQEKLKTKKTAARKHEIFMSNIAWNVLKWTTRVNLWTNYTELNTPKSSNETNFCKSKILCEIFMPNTYHYSQLRHWHRHSPCFHHTHVFYPHTFRYHMWIDTTSKCGQLEIGQWESQRDVIKKAGRCYGNIWGVHYE